MAEGGTALERPRAALLSPSLRQARTAFGLSRLTLIVTLLAAVAIAMREVIDPDLWWHMATGRYIAAHGTVPALDVFSFTATTHHWVTHEWLSDLLLYGGYRVVGLAGLGLAFAVVIAAAYGLVYLRCHSKPALAACAVLVAALAASPTYGARPQMFSLLFASLFLYLLDNPRVRGWRLWLLVPLTLVWANLHSGFVAGLAIIGVYAVGEGLAWLVRGDEQGPGAGSRVGQLVMVLLASLVAGLVTPNGLSALTFPFGTLGSHVIQDNIQEWASPNFHQAMAWPLAGYWLALLGVLAVSKRRVSATQFLLLLGASVAAMYSMRHAQFLSLVGAPVLAEGLGGLWPSREGVGAMARPTPRPLRIGLWLVIGALVVVLGGLGKAMVNRTAEAEQALYPAAALDYMREHGIGGRVFNTYHWGGYLIWHGYPVFVDGRAEVYGDEVLGEYVKAWSVEPDWEEPLQRYGVEVVLIETDSPLAVVLQESGRWKPVFRDKLATVFVPSETALAPLGHPAQGALVAS